MSHPLRLLQFSDLHLGAPGYAPSLGLPEEWGGSLTDDLAAVLDRIVDLARDREVDAVLVPGDLFDDEAVDVDTVQRAAEAFAGLAPQPVVIAPGNHDPYRLDGYYGPLLLPARGRPGWPDNVILFTREEWTSVALPGREDTSVTGAAHLRPVPVEERRLGRRIERREAAMTLLLVHGSRDGFAPPGKRVTLPFGKEELLGQGFTYAALGHYHEHSILRDRHGVARAAYAGCPLGRGLDETGPRGVLQVTITPDGAQEVEFVPVAERLVYRLPVEVGRVEGTGQVLEAVARTLQEAGTGPRDLVVAEVSGRMPPGEILEIPDGFMADTVGHLTVRSGDLRPDYDLEAYRSGEAPPSTETRFARRLLDAMESADDPGERARLREALDLGLDALHGYPVRLR